MFHIILLLVQLILTFVFANINAGAFLLNVFNYLTYLLLIHVTLFLSLLTIKGRFFDGITYGFKKAFARDKQSIDDEFSRLAPSEKVSDFAIKLFRFQTFALLLVNVIMLAIYLW
ncbi:hypothetical protein DES38_101203 [Streptohalobacillus salinus]|uniref:DUF3899 domain-containing protein n=1 Tax=Streptohalobacillus salinus TaxID=621096 RepID=A0A2V3WE01_9BACI|nr:hypothetical protein [Streptohalobacillus salinus]PXW93120.1 hypothetical protein DES38_101203 [Streptohalobacillus salinus]